MKQADLRRLNRQFEVFGRNPHGGLKFKWALTQDLPYWFYCGQVEKYRTFESKVIDGRLSSPGLYVIEPTWSQHTFANQHGANRYCIAMWEHKSQEEWLREVGNQFPWQKHGTYAPIESTVMPEGMDPDEDLTSFSVSKIYQNLEMVDPNPEREYQRHLERAYEVVNAAKKSQRSMSDDMIDDAFPAFGNIPGEKMHVSFPPIEKQTQRSV